MPLPLACATSDDLLYKNQSFEKVLRLFEPMTLRLPIFSLSI